jgi:putative chitinase
MDYPTIINPATATSLNKYQWDLIHYPNKEWFSWLESEEEGEVKGSWTILDNKHTLLFNHVYDNNHEGNLKYIEKIAHSLTSNPAEESLDLEYTGNEEKEWISQWKLRTVSSDQLLEKIINKIQKAVNGEKIETLRLKAKGIYLGKFTIDGVEYPMAVYSEEDVIDNITKVEVTEISELDKEENKKHIKAEETFIKYLVIAFYEENKSDPVLMLQIEKFDFSKAQNTKKKWLEFLGILKEKVEKKEDINTIFSEEKLKELYPKVDEKIIRDIFYYITTYKDDYGIDNCVKLIHFLSQVDHESGGFLYMKEKKSFSEEREKYKGRGIFQLTFKNNYLKFQEHLKTKYNVEVDLISKPELVEQPKYAVLSALWYWQTNNLSNYAVDLKEGTALKISKLVNCGNLSFCGCEKDEEGNCKVDENKNKIKCYDCFPMGWQDRKDKFKKYKLIIKCD